MLKQISNQYYSKITLICVATVCIVTASMLSVASSFIQEHEKTEYLKNYEITLNNLSSLLAGRASSFADTFAPIFGNADDYDALCDFYLNPTVSSATTSNEAILKLLENLCNSDQYCHGVLLLTRTGRLYQYDKRYASLVPLKLRETTFQFTPYEFQIITDSWLSSMSNDYEKPASYTYGLSGTVFLHEEGKVSNLGYLITLYSTDEFSTMIADVRLDPSCVFTISDRNHNIIFSSADNYTDYTDFLLNAIQADSDNSKWYSSSIYSSRYHYLTSYQIPYKALSVSRTQYALVLFGCVVCLFSVLLYIIAFRHSNHKIKAIQNGMGHISQNDLSYRMTVPRSNDEFTQIIKSFNQMCSELQRNVEKAYIYEISQRKAELYAMQTSINPHFLYNTLEQVRVLVMSGQASNAAQMILVLSKIYRNQTRRNLYISIGEECSHMENLLQLYMLRYHNFDYLFNIDTSVKKYGLPKNTLQPLLENYFVHGLIPDSDDNIVTVSITSISADNGQYLEIAIEDNGASISAEELALLQEKLNQPVLSRNEENGFALSNVNTRLKLVFGEAAALCPSAGSNHCGFRISFRIPPVLPEDLMNKN